MEPYTITGPDPANAGHVLILVRGREFSVVAGTEQETADEIARNLDGAA